MFDSSLDWWMKKHEYGADYTHNEPVEGPKMPCGKLRKYRQHRKIRNRIARESRRRNR